VPGVAPGQSATAAVPASSTLPPPLYLGDTSAPYARGVDVSHYQADVPWQTLADNGVLYAFAKATEGPTYRDPRFSANWSAMKAHGLLRGAYHMWHPDDDPVAQARFFASVVGTGSDLPPVIDVELNPTQIDCPTLLANILTFMQTVEQELGSITALYTYRKYWVEHLTCSSNASASAITQSLAQRPLWVADYSRTDAPELFGGRSNWAFWQYTDQGDAAADHLDLDRFAGTPQTLRTWLDDLKSLSAWQQGNKKR
jgi:lysozyme